MNWRGRLEAVRAEKSGKGQSSEPTKPTEPPFVSFVSEQNGPFVEKIASNGDHLDNHDTQGDETGLRRRLLRLAESDGRPLAIVHRLHAEDLGACEGLDDNALLTYLRLLERSERIAAGQQPPELTQPAHCDGCGPVWLHEGAPARVRACAWCFRRKAGKAIPRPPVACGSCEHYKPDPINPTGGAGDCSLSLSARWPNARHVCPGHSPGAAAEKQSKESTTT